MDYLKVEERFRRHACWVQGVLLGGLILFFGYRVVQMVRHADEPPIETVMQKWRGLSKWKMCVRAGGEEGDLHAVGIWVLDDEQYRPPMSGPQIEDMPEHGGTFRCITINLTDMEVPAIPTNVNMCNEAANVVHVFVWSNQAWRHVIHQPRWTNMVIKIEKHRHGNFNGFSSEAYEMYSTYMWEHYTTPGTGYAAECRHWQVADPSRSEDVSRLQLRIEQPLVMTSFEQGILPQILALLSSVGGFVSLLVLVFTTVFVRKYPSSSTAMTYETRTLFGNQAGGDPPLDIQAIRSSE